MESLFSFNNYREFLDTKIQSLPKQGYGVVGKLATHVGVHPSLISQILKGDKQLTVDQAFATTEFFGLSNMESEYFILLVQIDRAATAKLKAFFQAKIDALREDSSQLSKRLEHKQILSNDAKGIFYSDWTYTAIRQMTAIAKFSSAEAIAQSLDLPIKEVRNVIDFLVLHGLCKTNERGYALGPQSTHLPASSPWVKVHHKNWRQRAVEKMNQPDAEALFYSCPLTIAKSDVEKIRELIIQCIEQVNKVVDPSPSEELCCLNIDWFRAARI